MTKINKHYTMQEYMETFSSIQDMYDYYFEMQQEIDKLSEYNLHLVRQTNNYEELLLKSNNKLDKIKEYCKNKIEKQKNMTDFSKYYLENYDKAINTQHLSHSGVMLETIKSTTIKRYEDILEILDKESK